MHTPFNTCFLVSPEYIPHMASQSVGMVPLAHPSPQPKQHVFMQGSQLWQTDRLTDHATLSITMGHIYIVLRCGLIMAVKWSGGG